MTPLSRRLRSVGFSLKGLWLEGFQPTIPWNIFREKLWKYAKALFDPLLGQVSHTFTSKLSRNIIFWKLSLWDMSIMDQLSQVRSEHFFTTLRLYLVFSYFQATFSYQYQERVMRVSWTMYLWLAIFPKPVPKLTRTNL